MNEGCERSSMTGDEGGFKDCRRRLSLDSRQTQGPGGVKNQNKLPGGGEI